MSTLAGDSPRVPESKLSPTAPVQSSELESICSNALSTSVPSPSTTTYSHESTSTWTSILISDILSKLTSSCSTHKFIVYATFVHSPPAGLTGQTAVYTAAGAYWDADKDGLWTWSHTLGKENDIHVIVTVTWIAK
ncbi:Tctex-1 [Lipomyces oligophaga]|uniref:Tctex-1 n=1 Tax=Lipomyces oligophaga TaxID=45792 RepID=UPI0034CE59F2